MRSLHFDYNPRGARSFSFILLLDIFSLLLFGKEDSYFRLFSPPARELNQRGQCSSTGVFRFPFPSTLARSRFHLPSQQTDFSLSPMPDEPRVLSTPEEKAIHFLENFFGFHHPFPSKASCCAFQRVFAWYGPPERHDSPSPFFFLPFQLCPFSCFFFFLIPVPCENLHSVHFTSARQDQFRYAGFSPPLFFSSLIV